MDRSETDRFRSDIEALRREAEGLREELVLLQRSHARLALLLRDQRTLLSAALTDLVEGPETVDAPLLRAA